MQGLSNHFLSDEHDIDHHHYFAAAAAAASAFDYSSLLLEDASNNDRIAARWSAAFVVPDDHQHRHHDQQHRDDLAEIVEDNVVAFNSRASAENKSGGNSSLHQSEDANLDYKCISFNARQEQGKNSEDRHEKRRFAAELQHNDQLMLIRDSSTEKRFDTIDRIIPPPQYPSSTTNMSSAKHMFYTANALQLTNKDEEDEEEGKAAAKKKVRRNMRISKDPQSVAARHRRERISQKIRILQRLVPGGTKMDTASMLEEAIQYVKFLKTQVQSLEMLGFAAEAPPAAINSKNNINFSTSSIIAPSSV